MVAGVSSVAGSAYSVVGSPGEDSPREGFSSVGVSRECTGGSTSVGSTTGAADPAAEDCVDSKAVDFKAGTDSVVGAGASGVGSIMAGSSALGVVSGVDTITADSMGGIESITVISSVTLDVLSCAGIVGLVFPALSPREISSNELVLLLGDSMGLISVLEEIGLGLDGEPICLLMVSRECMILSMLFSVAGLSSDFLSKKGEKVSGEVPVTTDVGAI